VVEFDDHEARSVERRSAERNAVEHERELRVRVKELEKERDSFKTAWERDSASSVEYYCALTQAKVRAEKAEAACREFKRQLVLMDAVVEAAKALDGNVDFHADEYELYPRAKALFAALAALDGGNEKGPKP